MPADIKVACHEAGSSDHHRSLQQLQDLGVSLPASWRSVAKDAGSTAEGRFWLSHSHPTAPLGVLLRVSRSRRVPWALIAHVEQLGDVYFAQHATRLAQLVRLGSQAVGRVMRVGIRLVHRQDNVRNTLAAAFQHEGARTATSHKMYTHTHVLEARRTATEMFAALPTLARRRIRQPVNHGLLVKTNAAQVGDIPRLLALMEAAFARTGGSAHRDQWQRDLTRAVHNPQYNPLVTLEHAQRSGAERIVAFALGAFNGDHITYHHGASERGGGLGGLSLGYAPIWALVEYGIAHGASWVDLGGITTSEDPNHALYGITAFKRNFGGQDAEVAHELSLTLNPTNVQLEQRIGRWLRR